MNKLIDHNQFLKDLILTADHHLEKSAVDLDTFDSILRACLTIDEMREIGSFFTGQELASKAVSLFTTELSLDSIILDPACGAGNLLIECSRKLDVKMTLSETLREWGIVLNGFDIYQSFIDAARLRLIIEALSRGVKKDCSLEQAFALLCNIKVKDALLVTEEELSSVTHLILNPPFTTVESPKENYWKKGKVNAAGVFVDKYIRKLPQSCNVSIILPDVLRSGARYVYFRDFLNACVDGNHLIWGRFNSKTDVDVFIIHGVLRKNNNNLWKKSLLNYIPLSSRYDVRIGPLVAYRDPKIGNEYPYFHAKNAISWSVIVKETETRRFAGTVLKPPFVLIKRTSNPNDKYRALATVINLTEYVAVENHMIVVTPKNGNLEDCIRLLDILKSQTTNDFLNERIRLRHLTVGAVKEIPIG
ncbi:N-6 DNA methylase [Atlantibacter hermannii]|uniref:N-6 DNA methylase n=1 Tax=Atlantibacter hermannii TaxID=565 RepID=UPI0028A243D5|nr:N-6 DNA methylase [Atlantibacter hermannii]